MFLTGRRGHPEKHGHRLSIADDFVLSVEKTGDYYTVPDREQPDGVYVYPSFSVLVPLENGSGILRAEGVLVIMQLRGS